MNTYYKLGDKMSVKQKLAELIEDFNIYLRDMNKITDDLIVEVIEKCEIESIELGMIDFLYEVCQIPYSKRLSRLELNFILDADLEWMYQNIEEEAIARRIY